MHFCINEQNGLNQLISAFHQALGHDLWELNFPYFKKVLIFQFDSVVGLDFKTINAPHCMVEVL